MNDYCNGIAYATGYIANDQKKPYLVVRNLEKYYVEMIENEVGYKAYKIKSKIQRDGRPQWAVKAWNIHELQPLNRIANAKDFCRSYMELHGNLDQATAKNRRGECYKRPRLRIYGKEEVIRYISSSLPAAEKKIQYVENIVDSKYIGKTCLIYYQSKTEILDILDWIDGTPRNEKVWEKWEQIVK